MTIISTLACTVSATGISRPAYSDIYATLQAQFQGIYGTDAVIDPSSQDGQLLAVFAKAIDDCNAAAVAAYNNYSPQTAQGAGLSSAVKINGLTRAVPTNSSVNLTIGGTVGTVINNGVASDGTNNWLLPASVTIPSGGSIVVTATAQNPGAIAAAAGTITQIGTPTLGWQTVTNASAATAGAPVETDAALRQRQSTSVALPSATVLAGIVGAVSAVAGVTQVKGFENDTKATDSNGIPANSIAIVAVGGAALDIANAILKKKAPGCYTYGTTSQAVSDSAGIPYTIRYFVASPQTISVAVTGNARTGYTTAIGAQIQAAIAAYINSLPIGSRVDISRLYLPAQLNGGTGWQTFEITGIQISISPAAVASSDIVLAFNQVPVCAAANVTLNIT